MQPRSPSRPPSARRAALLLGVAGWLCLTGAACRPAASPPGPLAHATPDQAPAAPPPFRLVEVAEARGVRFRHNHGTRTPLTIVEAMGGGCAFFDFDNDGWLDIFLVSSGQDFEQPRQTPESRLFRNTGDGSFVDVTAELGPVFNGYAMGCSVGDFDNDGYDDLFVTGYGRNWLFRNREGRGFEDVTARAGLLRRPGAWGIGSAFVDVNRDGRLDLYVANYIVYDPKLPYCTTAGVQHGCTPNQYATQRNELYLNLGNGKFREQAVALGADDPAGAGLGVVVCDFDNDGWPDIFIANDGTPDSLLHNRQGRFENVAHPAGVAYGDNGVMRAGMGTDAGDIDGDGLFDIVVTNFQNEPTSVFRNLGRMQFEEVSHPSGVGSASLNRLKFGVCFVDLDGDGRQDLYQGNGHVFDNVEEFNDIDTFEQVDQVFLSQGEGRFREISPETGAFPGTPSVARAVAAGDFNNDGAADILVNSLGRPARLLENRPTQPRHWVGLELIGTRSNRSAIGARVELETPAGLQVREVRSGSSYMGQSDLRVLFNLAETADPERLRLRIRWPSGQEQEVRPIPLNRYEQIREPE